MSNEIDKAINAIKSRRKINKKYEAKHEEINAQANAAHDECEKERRAEINEAINNLGGEWPQGINPVLIKGYGIDDVQKFLSTMMDAAKTVPLSLGNPDSIVSPYREETKELRLTGIWWAHISESDCQKILDALRDKMKVDRDMSWQDYRHIAFYGDDFDKENDKRHRKAPMTMTKNSRNGHGNQIELNTWWNYCVSIPRAKEFGHDMEEIWWHYMAMMNFLKSALK